MKFFLPLTFLAFYSFVLPAQWTQTNGPNAGLISSIAVSNSNIFAGTTNDGAHLSSDLAVTWAKKGLGTLKVNAFLINGTDVFAGTSGGLLLSSDNGNTWNTVNSGLTNTNVTSLATVGSAIFAGTYGGGIFKSINNGASWAASNTGLSNLWVMTLRVNGTALLAGTLGNGIFSSTNNGANWSAIGPVNQNIYSIALNGTAIYASSYGAVYYSINNGGSWTTLNSGLPASEFVNSIVLAGSDLIAGMSTSGIYRSVNNGATWTASNTGMGGREVQCLTKDGTGVYAGTYAGIYFSADNGITWLSKGLPVSTNVSLTSYGPDVYSLTDRVYTTNDDGSNWSDITNYSPVTTLNQIIRKGPYLFMVTYDGVYRSSDNGSSWSLFNSGLTQTVIRKIAVSGSNVYVSSSNGRIFKSSNDGVSWTEVNVTIPFTSVNVLESKGDTIYAGNNGLYYSSNQGASWTNVGPSGQDIYAIAARGPYIYAATSTTLIVSANYGSSWTYIGSTQGITTFPPRSIALKDHYVFVSTDNGGVYMSENNGVSFTSIQTGLPASGNINKLTVNDSCLFASVMNAAVWKRSLSELLGPGQASVINGDSSVCPDRTITYHVTSVSGMTYNWSYTGTGATLQASGDSLEIYFSPAATAGDVLVTLSNNWGTGPARTLPVTIKNCSFVVTSPRNLIAGGARHSLGVCEDSTMTSWGDAVSGKLGRTYINNMNRVPGVVPGQSAIKMVSAGEEYSMVLNSNGDVWSWGSNSYGQVGDGTTIDKNTPTQISSLSDVIWISGNRLHSSAVLSNGSVKTWGLNNRGQLGDGTLVNKSNPVLVSGLNNVIAVDGGYESTYALKSDGTVWSWGSNTNGQLGDGTSVDRSTPVKVMNLTDVIAISARFYHVLALKNDGTVWSWGYNSALGTIHYTPVKVAGLSNIIDISAGENHSLALEDNGKVWAWGGNFYGQLGNGNTNTLSVPVQVSSLEDVRFIGSGNNHSYAVKTNGTAWFWGNNGDGQFGDGSYLNQKNVPVEITQQCEMANTCVNTTQSSLAVQACISYTLNNQTYNTSGIYYQTLVNSAGCDSIITLDLTLQTIDTDVVQNGNTLSSETSGAAYQWVDCNNGLSTIAGQTGQSFIVTANGNYAVIVNLNSCIDTSSCVIVTGIGTAEESKGVVLAYPNPTHSDINVSGNVIGTFQLVNEFGQVVKTFELQSAGSSSISIQNLAAGIYYLMNDQIQYRQRIVVIR